MAKEWVKITDELPPIDKRVLVSKNNIVEMMFFHGFRQVECRKNGEVFYETHPCWMGDYGVVSSVNPDAWMDAPEPFKG